MTNNRQEQPTANGTYMKLAIQTLNEALFFVSSSVLADSFVLLNRQLLVLAKRSGNSTHPGNKIDFLS